MKVMTLNIWGGYVLEPLLKFMRAHQDVDVFCLQEVYHHAEKMASDEDRAVTLDSLSQMNAQLPEHVPFFRPVVNNSYGIAMLVRESVNVLSEREAFIHENKNYIGIGPTHSRILQCLECESEGQRYAVVNVHGLWNGKGKGDSPERILQSQSIKKFIDALDCPTLLCGDFNLRPDTESFGIVAEGLVDLIASHNITSTRTSYYEKTERFADYMLLSPDLTLRSFTVLPDEVSDHAPLLAEFYAE